MNIKPSNYSLILTFAILTIVINGAKGQAQNTTGWKGGVSSIVITPTQSLWMAGYANRNRPSEGTLTNLMAKALALEDASGKRVVLITADLVGIPKEFSNTLRDRLQFKFHLKRSQIIINTSHTHTGPVLTDALKDLYPLDPYQVKKIDQYTNELSYKLELLVGKALHSLQPVKLYTGNGVTRFQVNRRNNDETNLRQQTELKGPNDYAVPVIKIVNSTGKLIAVAFGYACHNTVLNDYKFSGDYAGFAQLELQKKYPDVTALFLQGCGANQNPLPRRTVALAIQYGQELSAAVVRVLSEDMKEAAPVIETAYTEVELPLHPPPSKEELLKMSTELPDAYQKRWAARLLQKTERGDKLIASYPYPVEVWKMGDQIIVALGGEVVIEYALALKKILGQEIFVLGYSNDVMAYIPNVAILREGGYEGKSSQMVYGMPNTWKESIEELIINQVVKMAKQVGVSIPE